MNRGREAPSIKQMNTENIENAEKKNG